MLKIVFILIVVMFLSCKSTSTETTQEKVSQLELKETTATPESRIIYNADSTTVKFKGVVTNVKNDCWADGTCSIEIDNKWWLAITYGKRDPSRIPKERGKDNIKFTEDNKSVGKKVKIYAKIKKRNKLTLEGSNTYYALIIK